MTRQDERILGSLLFLPPNMPGMLSPPLDRDHRRTNERVRSNKE